MNKVIFLFFLLYACILLYQGSQEWVNNEKLDVAERSSEASLLIGKYVYSRRRSLVRKRSGSFFKSLTMEDNGNPNQVSKRARRGYTPKYIHQAPQVETIGLNSEKKVLAPENNTSISGVKGSSLHTQTSDKVARLILSILFSSKLISQTQNSN